MTEAVKGVEIANGEALVWSEPAERARMAVQPGDILKAISWFEGLTGRKPKLMMLHPKNKNLAGQVPDGIKVSTSRGGVLLWEIWLCPSDSFGTVSEATESKITRPKSRTLPITYRAPREGFAGGENRRTCSSGAWREGHS